MQLNGIDDASSNNKARDEIETFVNLFNDLEQYRVCTVGHLIR